MARFSKLFGFALVFTLPLTASAQVTAHKVNLSLKGLAQTTTNNDDMKPESFSAKSSDVFEVCTGERPEKDEGVYLFFDCQDLNNNMIAAIDTDPLSLIQDLGSVDLDLDNAVLKTQNGVLKSASVPAEIEIECEEAVFSTFAILDVNYKDLEDEACPNNAKAKIIGIGDVEGESFIVDDGSSLDAANRSAAIGAFPPK